MMQKMIVYSDPPSKKEPKVKDSVNVEPDDETDDMNLTYIICLGTVAVAIIGAIFIFYVWFRSKRHHWTAVKKVDDDNDAPITAL